MGAAGVLSAPSPRAAAALLLGALSAVSAPPAPSLAQEAPPPQLTVIGVGAGVTCEEWLTTAGALTYPFYLVHEHLGWFVIRVLHRGWGVPPWPTLAATVPTMLGLAWLIHRFAETPLGPRLRRALKNA